MATEHVEVVRRTGLEATMSDGGVMAVMSDRWPPAECPVVTMRDVSRLYSLALRATHRSATRP